MTNLLEEAINSNDGDHAESSLKKRIESDDVANYVFPKAWPSGCLQPFADDPSALLTVARDRSAASSSTPAWWLWNTAGAASG